jgi:hypothetical protein
MNGFVVSGLQMLSGVVLLSPMLIMAQSMGPHEISRIASPANESNCLLLSMRNGQKITLRGKVRSTAHDMAFDVPGCDQTVLLTYAGDRDNDVSATELRKDKELIRFQKYTSEVYKSRGKNICMECPKFGDVEADLTGKLEVATMPDGATKDWAGFLRDRSGKLIGTYGWGHPSPFAAYRLVIESVSQVTARKLPRPRAL